MTKTQHEIWCKELISQGWTYGTLRNDELKQHPFLVEYESLPDIEKAIDRSVVSTTFDIICKERYRILRNYWCPIKLYN